MYSIKIIHLYIYTDSYINVPAGVSQIGLPESHLLRRLKLSLHMTMTPKLSELSRRLVWIGSSVTSIVCATQWSVATGPF